jgi:hypothetical protein
MPIGQVISHVLLLLNTVTKEFLTKGFEIQRTPLYTIGHLTLSIPSTFFVFSTPTFISCREYYCLLGFVTLQSLLLFFYSVTPI